MKLSECPSCGKTNSTEAMFCKQCGYKFPERRDLKPVGPWQCPNCGSLNQADGAFCESCGTRFASAPLGQTSIPPAKPLATPQSVGPARRSSVRPLAILIILFSIVTVGFLAYNAYQTQQEAASLNANHSFVINVSSTGCWTGAIGGVNSGDRSVQGCGSQSWNLSDTIASADFQMQDAGNTISLSITKDGTVCVQQTSSADYGVVSGGC
jgi:hypothetical protein